MATPLGHGLAGYAIGLALSRGRSGGWVPLGAAVVLAIAPDLDFVPGLLLGQPALYHQGATHSLVVGLVVALAAAVVGMPGWERKSVFLLVLAAWSSHLLLDLCGPDQRLPYGLPLLWPLGAQHFLSPYPLLPGMRHAGHTHADTKQWLAGIFSLYNVMALAVELAVVSPFVWMARRRAGRWV